MFSTDDCEGGRYFAETSGHSRGKVNRIELRTRKETLISFTYYPSTYNDNILCRVVVRYPHHTSLQTPQDFSRILKNGKESKMY